jgi:hypothetical protein
MAYCVRNESSEEEDLIGPREDDPNPRRPRQHMIWLVCGQAHSHQKKRGNQTWKKRPMLFRLLTYPPR